MMRVALLLVVAACGCRRHHTPPSYGEDTPLSGAAPAAPATPATTLAPKSGPSATTPVRRDNAPRLPDGGTINGDPRGPRAAEFDRVVDGAMPRLRACFDRAELPAGKIAISAHYTVEPPGYTGAITVRGNAPQAVLDCCRGVIDALRFPEFRGNKVEQDLPFSYEKREKAVRIEIWDAAAKPEAP